MMLRRLSLGGAIFILAACASPKNGGKGIGADSRRDALEAQFAGIVSREKGDSFYFKAEKLRQFVSREKISDQELAAACLDFGSRNNVGETMLGVGFCVKLAAGDVVEIGKVWTAGLASDDPNRRRAAEVLLMQLEYGASESLSFRVYQSILAQSPEAMNVRLVEHMYGQDPGQAFLAIVSATRNVAPEKREESFKRAADLHFAHHVIEYATWYRSNLKKEGREEAQKNARAEIEKLAEAPEWWVRLYAAHICRDDGDLRDAAILQKLSEDKNESVRKVIQPALPLHLRSTTRP